MSRSVFIQTVLKTNNAYSDIMRMSSDATMLTILYYNELNFCLKKTYTLKTSNKAGEVLPTNLNVIVTITFAFFKFSYPDIIHMENVSMYLISKTYA